MMSSPAITINIELAASREPYLYEQALAIPDLMRQAVFRNLLESAIATPYDIAAITANAAMYSQASSANPGAQLVVRLTLKPDRPEDRQLHRYFTGISAGRRRPEARALLTKGLLQGGQRSASVHPAPADRGVQLSEFSPAQPATTSNGGAAAQPKQPARASAPVHVDQATRAASPSVAPQTNAPANELDDLLDAVAFR